MPQLRLKASGGFIDKGVGGPVASAMANIDNEILQKYFAFCGMIDLWMKLNTEGWFICYCITGYLNVMGRANHLIVGRDFFDGIAMRHPDLGAFGKAFGKDVCVVDKIEMSASVFTGI